MFSLRERYSPAVVPEQGWVAGWTGTASRCWDRRLSRPMPSPPRTASDGYRSTLRPVAESHQWITAEINYVADGHPHVRHPPGWRTRTGAPTASAHPDRPAAGRTPNHRAPDRSATAGNALPTDDPSPRYGKHTAGNTDDRL